MPIDRLIPYHGPRNPKHDLETGYWADEEADLKPIEGKCADCGEPFISGQEKRDGICHTCITERAG